MGIRPSLLAAHAAVLTLIDRDACLGQSLRHYFCLAPRGPLLLQMQLDGLGQADLVLGLLRIGGRVARHRAEEVIGRPITTFPPTLLRWRTNTQTPSLARPCRAPVVTYVIGANPRKPGTRAHAAFEAFRAGRTVEQLRVRGVRTRDVTSALRRGWIAMETTA